MKLVKIKINNRVDRILNFDEPIQLHNNTFIIRDYAGGEAELFRIDKDAIVITDHGHLPLTIKRIDSGNGVLDVYLSTEAVDSKSNSSRGFFSFGRSNEVDQNDRISGLSEKDGSMVYEMTKPNNNDHYELRFHLIVPSQNQENTTEINPISIFVYYATTDETFDAIVDFGSEASQALWRNKNDQEFVDLTASILKQHTSITGKKKEDFVQFESKQLYKSIYYLRKELKESELTTWPVYDGNLWKFLVANDDLTTLRDYMQLPNTKLFNFDISEYTELEVLQDDETVLLKRLGNEENIIGRILMNNIVCQVLHAIKKNSKKLDSAYIVLNILMPNVYPIHLVSEKLDHLAIDISKFLEDEKKTEDNSDFSRIKAIELRSISESDASFLGYYNSKKVGFLRGNYLIMDAGKGTLDFSIMEFAKKGVPFVNKSRAGIVGAGNAITYGLLIGLVNDYLLTVLSGYQNKDINDKHTLIKEFIYNLFFEEQDIAKKMELLKAVEKYKKTYNQLFSKEPVEVQKIDEPLNSLSDVFSDNKDKNSFLKFIEGLTQNDNNITGTNLSEESQKYVTTEIENIVNAAVRKLEDITTPDMKITGVIFTGRGFLMKELQEVMHRQLIDHKIIGEGTPIKNGEDKGNEMKKICMEINQLLVSDKYDASPSRQSVAVHNGDIPAEDRANAPIDTETQERITEAGNDFDDDSHGGYREASEDDYAKATIIPSEKIESVGIPVGKLTNASSIIIAGWRYDVNQKFQGKEATLFFDGFKYCLTADGVSQQISANIANPSAASLGYESLFPNVNLQDKNGVKIPTAIKEPNAKKKETKEEAPSSGDAPANEPDTTPANNQVTDDQSSTVRKTKKKVKKSKLKSIFDDFTSLISGGTSNDDDSSDGNDVDTNDIPNTDDTLADE